jgi:glucose/mannose transport system substrate-binding protein
MSASATLEAGLATQLAESMVGRSEEESKMKYSLGSSAFLAAVALAVSACSSNSDSSNAVGSGGSAGGTTVEMFSWWVAPGEAEALQALVDTNKAQYPADRIINAAKDTSVDEKKILSDRLAAGMPPDLFQQNAYEMAALIAAHPGTVQPLDDLFAKLGLNTLVVPEVLAGVTIDGHIYSMPVNIHRENALFYNKQIFADNALEPPTTQAEFLAVCEALKAKGITPVAVSTSQGWIVTKLFNELALGSMGGQAFVDYFSGAKPLDEAAMGTAIDLLDQVLTNYINADAGDADFGWTNAASAVYNSKAAMFLHGDWAKAYLVQLGWTPDVDFGVIGSPGAADTFTYGNDVFGLPVGAKNVQGATDFLSTIATLDGQVAFNTLKGSTTMRLDTPSDKFDSMGKAVLANFKDAKIRFAMTGKGAWDDAMLAFAASHDKAALVQAFKDNPPGQ